jgi:hypothetical protein
VKGTPELARRVRQHVTDRWAGEVVSEHTGSDMWWPRSYTIGRPTSDALTTRFDEVIETVEQYRKWAETEDLELVESGIRRDGIVYPLPSHVLVPNLDVASRIAGGNWPARVARSREYAAVIDDRFPHRRHVLARTIATVADWDPVDVDLLCRAAAWFEQNDASTYSPREVPLEGFHTKWLETRRGAVSRLAGLDDLGLRQPHQSRIHFTYLDNAHVEAGGRQHDSATVGDTFTPPYSPRVVVICENKDTAIHFPHVEGGIAVEGGGSGAAPFATFPWLRDAPLVVYWGDMDADGLRILAQFRRAGIHARSLFMDYAAYERWERWGTVTDQHGKVLTADERPAPEELDDGERNLYDKLTAANWTRYRRIEQEKIPVRDAFLAVQQMRVAATGA